MRVRRLGWAGIEVQSQEASVVVDHILGWKSIEPYIGPPRTPLLPTESPGNSLAAFVTAIEKDPRCVEALRPLVAAAEGRLRVIGGDALRLPLAEVADAPATVVANLPYNVGTALLVGWLHELDRVRAMHLMFQREVALRLGAAPGGADYGRLSVLAQLLCRVERRFDLPPGAFQPPPKVRSSVVSLWPLESRPEGTRLRALERVTAAAFGQRRKMLRSSLNGLGQAPEALAEAAGVSATARAETLAPAQFLKMAERLVGG